MVRFWQNSNFPFKSEDEEAKDQVCGGITDGHWGGKGATMGENESCLEGR